MARRFDAIYRVKPKDNLGDPEYWNRRFDDIDRRVSASEDGLDAIGGLTAYIEGLALNRLDLVLAPALDKITLVSEQGFLLAHSNSTVTLDVSTTQTFAIPDAAERELFAPSPYLTITREANMTDYAFAKLIDYDKVSGQLIIQPLQIMGNPGPFSDWAIYVGTAISQAVATILDQTRAARDLALQYKGDAAASAVQTATDRTDVSIMRSDALAARDAAQTAAANAQTWNAALYSTTTQMNTAITAAVNNLLNGAPGALDTLNELATALGNDAAFSTTVTTALANRLRVDINNQGLTGTQQTNARTNLGLGNAAVANKATVANIRAKSAAGSVLGLDEAWDSCAFVDFGNSGSGNINIDCTLGARFRVILTGNVTVNFLNPRDGQVVDLVFIQDATGGRTVSWNGFVRFPDAQAPTVATAANGWAVIFTGVYNSTHAQWLGAGWKVN